MNDHRKPIDHSARLAAVSDFDRNLVVIAGAGTGKTSLLVERALTALGSGRVDVERLAALTFTEKAAGELRQRLAAGLEHLRAVCRGEIESRQDGAADRAARQLVERFGVDRSVAADRALRALQRLDRAQVGTIHGFCSALLREHPLEGGVDPRFTVDSGEVFETLVREQWERFAGVELGAAAPRAALWERVLDTHTLRDVEQVARLLSRFDMPLESLDQAAPAAAVEDLLGSEIRRLMRDIDVVLAAVEGSSVGAARLEAARDALAALLSGGIDKFVEHVERRPELESKLKAGEPTIKKLGDDARDAAKRFGILCDNLLRVDDRAVADLVGAVLPFCRAVRERLQREGYLTFDALLALTRDMLRDHPQLRERLKRRFDMLLLDEFQDTDPLQYEIVFFLGEAPGGSASDAYSAELQPGRLFIVGDPKQSIYRFRGADYSAFRRAVGRVRQQGGTVLRLTANFRSVPELVQPVNRLFGERSRYWRPSAVQPDYDAIHAERPGGQGKPHLEVWTVRIPGTALAKERREAEGKLVAREIRELVQSGACYGQITVLLRAFTHLPDYLRPLRELEVPFIVDGGREFLKRPEVSHLLCILKALARPADPVALLAFLRSPVGAVPDTELARYAADGGRWDGRQKLDAERYPDLARALSLLAELSKRAREAPPGEVVRRVLEHTPLLTLSAAAFEGPQRVANLEKLAAGAVELAQDGRLSLIEIVEALEAGRTTHAETDSPLADEQIDAVKVMTIHKAKGLENDIVFIPDLAKQEHVSRPGPLAANVLRTEEGAVLALRTNACVNLPRVRYALEKRLHEEAEEARVLYVGLTRARERLTVLAAPSRGKAPWVEALRPWGYRVGQAFDHGSELCDGQVQHEVREVGRWGRGRSTRRHTGVPEAVRAYEQDLERVRRLARPPLSAPSEEQLPVASEVDDGRLRRGRSDDDEGPRLVGLAVHRLLERWDGRTPATLLEHAAQVCRMVAPDGADSVEREVREILEGFLASQLPERFRGVTRLGREVPMLFDDSSGVVWRGTIDLLYRDPGGTLVVADYKTDRASDPDTLTQRYRRQLELYAQATQRAFGLLLPPQAEIWHLRSGRRIALGTLPAGGVSPRR